MTTRWNDRDLIPQHRDKVGSYVATMILQPFLEPLDLLFLPDGKKRLPKTAPFTVFLCPKGFNRINQGLCIPNAFFSECMKRLFVILGRSQSWLLQIIDKLWQPRGDRFQIDMLFGTPRRRIIYFVCWWDQLCAVIDELYNISSKSNGSEWIEHRECRGNCGVSWVWNWSEPSWIRNLLMEVDQGSMQEMRVLGGKDRGAIHCGSAW